MMKLIDLNNVHRTANAAARRTTLASRLSPPLPSNNGGSRRTTYVTASQPAPNTYLPRLTDGKKKLLNEHEGCTRCRTFYSGHQAVACPMKEADTWPEASTYKTLTLEMVLAAKPRLVAGFVGVHEGSDDDTFNDDITDDGCVLSPISFTVPHLVASLEITRPAITEFPLSVQSLLDIRCPSTVISDALATKLGHRRFKLPPEENNLSSLSNTLLEAKEYVKLEATSGNGAWVSGVFYAKVVVGLPVPLILGMPFLSSQHIVLDTHQRTVINT
ncbi:hypothetical protein FA15DRAFT_710688 [Coprinopsis marcescibilis]|uniref:Uncharacterized protein n=1 Tax=Coprinopsis marcescibilis TaxID=230819 RepID=A0A5C3KBT6_COPMA|nr:hypothetical protein FA15DRAFT_710688 [Coprinopsis marcescibilis]